MDTLITTQLQFHVLTFSSGACRLAITTNIVSLHRLEPELRAAGIPSLFSNAGHLYASEQRSRDHAGAQRNSRPLPAADNHAWSQAIEHAQVAHPGSVGVILVDL
jgi:hypothetical protein